MINTTQEATAELRVPVPKGVRLRDVPSELRVVGVRLRDVPSELRVVAEGQSTRGEAVAALRRFVAAIVAATEETDSSV